MRVMMLLKSDASAEAGVMPDERLLTDMGNYNQAMADAGVMLGGEGLGPSKHGARVRIERGKTRVIDGPFAEAKELIAGYFMLQTKSLAEAIEWAQRIPGEPTNPESEGELELRPLYETEDFPVDPAEQSGGWREKEQQARKSPPAPGPEKGPRWIAFLKANKHTEAGILPDEKLLQEMGALIQDMTDKGVLIGGEGLRPSKEGAKLRIQKSKRTWVDGPFTEAKELIAGFMMFRAQTKAEAIEWARRWLQIHVDGAGLDSAEIEVRRVFETDDIPVNDQETPGGWREQEKRLRERLGQ